MKASVSMTGSVVMMMIGRNVNAVRFLERFGVKSRLRQSLVAGRYRLFRYSQLVVQIVAIADCSSASVTGLAQLVERVTRHAGGHDDKGERYHGDFVQDAHRKMQR